MKADDGTGDSAAYRFEPLARRGLLLGLGFGELAVLAVALVVAVLVVHACRGAAGLAGGVAVLAAGGALCRPVAGRAPLHWAVVCATFAGRPKRSVLRPFRAADRPPLSAGPLTAPGAGAAPQRSRFPLKAFAPRTWVDQVGPTPGHGAVGALLDTRAGTAAAVLRVRGSPFYLLDASEKQRKLASWAGALESVCASRNSLVRLQWCQRAHQDGSRALAAHLSKAGDPASPGYANHHELVESAGERAWRHDTFVVVVTRCALRRRRLDDHGAKVLLNEVEAFRTQLHNAGFSCDGVLDGDGLSAALGNFLVPGLDRSPGAHPWPLAIEERWDAFHADGFWYRTYWVAEWPRHHVGPDFLSPLLIGKGRRCFSVVLAPVPPERAARDAESARTAQAADAHLRAQGGFLETARQRRRAEALEGREELLADGRGSFCFAGYVAVSGGSLEELDRSCAELERAAAASKLYLRLLFGQQRQALTWALPFGSGI